MNAPLRHQVQWVTPAPLWKTAARKSEVMRRPTILGFASDNFMDDLFAQLERRPEGIESRVASERSPSFRERLPGEPYNVAKSTPQLKLYQPAHGWFYLVAGSLVCELPGLPDHRVDLAAGESAGFVLRRRAGGGELALVIGEDGQKAWRAVANAGTLMVGEEILPLFPVAFQQDDRRRKLMAGVIPAGSQDALQAAPIGEPPPSSDGRPGPADALEDVNSRVVGAIELLRAQGVSGEAATETSRFVLMDLADFLTHFVPSAMTAIRSGATPSGAAGALVTLLRSEKADPQLDQKSLAELLSGVLDVPLTTPFSHNLGHLSVGVAATLGVRLKAALEEAEKVELDQVPVETQNVTTTSYVTRLVYQRHTCAPLHPPVVSPPSEPFVLASYFDPDAPGRPIRIALPFDPSIKGLRQFRKNVKLVLSDALRQKVKSIGKINDAIEGPGFDCGGFSLSIPIITICAMIILFVFLNLLNIIFWWLPFVKICFPKIKVEL